MSHDLKTMRAPVTRVNYPADKTPAALTVAGNASKPTTPANPAESNVYLIPLIAKDIDAGKPDSNVNEVEEVWQFQFATDSATSDCLVTVWCYNHWTSTWHPWAKINVKGDDLLTTAAGGIWTANGAMGSSHIGIQVENHAGQELYVTHMWR